LRFQYTFNERIKHIKSFDRSGTDEDKGQMADPNSTEIATKTVDVCASARHSTTRNKPSVTSFLMEHKHTRSHNNANSKNVSQT